MWICVCGMFGRGGLGQIFEKFGVVLGLSFGV